MANRPAAALALRDGDREELSRLTRSSTVRAGLAQRARIVLLAADGESNTAIAERVGVSRPTVIAWRNRYAAAGVWPGWTTSRARVGRARSTIAAIVAATLAPPPKQYGVTHWSSRLLGRHLGVGNATVARAWRDYGVQPWRVGDVQVLHRPRAGRQGHRRGRAVPGAAGERDRAVRRREVPDPGAGPDRADAADAARSAGAAHPRLRPARHLDAVRRAGDRHRHRSPRACKPRHRHQEFLAFLKQVARAYPEPASCTW